MSFQYSVVNSPRKPPQFIPSLSNYHPTSSTPAPPFCIGCYCILTLSRLSEGYYKIPTQWTRNFIRILKPRPPVPEDSTSDLQLIRSIHHHGQVIESQQQHPKSVAVYTRQTSPGQRACQLLQRQIIHFRDRQFPLLHYRGGRYDAPFRNRSLWSKLRN